jgi:hypothetical protein
MIINIRNKMHSVSGMGQIAALPPPLGSPVQRSATIVFKSCLYFQSKQLLSKTENMKFEPQAVGLKIIILMFP